MGIKNSYKAFVGLEFSMGNFCKTTACFSIDRKVQPVDKNHKVRAESEEDVNSDNGFNRKSHIKEAVYTIVDEQGNYIKPEFIGDTASLSQEKLPKHIYQYLKTEQQFLYQKGQALDFLV